MREVQDRGRPPGNCRDFTDVVWQIGNKHCCDEVLVHYDCGHCMRATVWVPALPNTTEYTNQEMERRRFMQHSVFVLTKDPGSPKVQITVPEGYCRHCGRGQRLALLCGHLQMDLVDEKEKEMQAVALQRRQVPAAARRLELVLSSHVFLAAMGQVCRLPDDILPPSTNLRNGVFNPLQGALPAHEGSFQISRKDIEDELARKVARYLGGATFFLFAVLAQCLYFMVMWFDDGSEASRLSRSLIAWLGMAPSWLPSWVRDMFAVLEVPKEDGSYISICWSWCSWIGQPLGFLSPFILTPLAWTLDVVMVLIHLVFNVLSALVRGLMLPCRWSFGVVLHIITNPMALISQLMSLPMSVISLMSFNAMLGGLLLSLLVVVLSAPQPLSLLLQSVCGELPSLGLGRGNQRFSRLWHHSGKENGIQGSMPVARKKDAHAGGGRVESNGSGPSGHRADKDGHCRPCASSSQSVCFVCLERPSHYILEPCGHRVVCGDCAVRIMEVASKGRLGEVTSGRHPSEKSGGTCPNCGQAVKQAMRIFS